MQSDNIRDTLPKNLEACSVRILELYMTPGTLNAAEQCDQLSSGASA